MSVVIQLIPKVNSTVILPTLVVPALTIMHLNSNDRNQVCEYHPRILSCNELDQMTSFFVTKYLKPCWNETSYARQLCTKIIVVPQLSSGKWHNSFTKTRQPDHANEQSVYSKFSIFLDSYSYEKGCITIIILGWKCLPMRNTLTYRLSILPKRSRGSWSWIQQKRSCRWVGTWLQSHKTFFFLCKQGWTKIEKT
jgi:hypothetical protein